MQVSEAWLREWCDPPWDSAALAQRLTMAGFEVEGRAAAAPAFSGVVVGQILECQPHPQAQQLSVCVVTTDGQNRLQIVCGARNARAGLKVAAALVGADLPGDVRVQPRQLRGVESQGMLCSARELGLGDQSDGILELPEEYKLGSNLRSALNLDDMVLQVNLTPNRGDCLSIAGLSREVSALLGRRLPKRDFPIVQAVVDQRLFVKLTAPRGCPKFVGRVIRGVNARALAPLWLRERLRRSGLRSINPIVDVTNYVMLELGTPMHAYDLTHLHTGIEVRYATAGEAIKLLDGKTVTLDPQTLVIADGTGAVGLAGVMGGERTAVSEATSDVFLEIAYFTPAAVAVAARRHGLITDAAQRFERGVDPMAQERAMERATRLLIDSAGGAPGPAVVTVERDYLPQLQPVALRRRQLDRLLGVAVPDAQVKLSLEALGLDVQSTADGWRAMPPSHRFDLTIEADLVEEVGRIVGYEAVPEQDARIAQVFDPLAEGRVSADRVLFMSADRGYQEAITYSFVDPKLQELLFPGVAQLPISNPIAADLSVMRVSLWPGLLHALRENLRRQQERVRLFESGKKFLLTETGLQEIAAIAAVAAGPALPEQWGDKARGVDFFDVKADVQALIELTGSVGEFEFRAEALSCLHPGRSARILRRGSPVGWLGELHPELVRTLDLTYAPLLFELETTGAFESKIPVFEEVSRFPSIRRDLSVVVDDSVPLAALREHVSVSAHSLLRDLRIFDVYRGPGVDSGRKSVALGLILQETSRTLTDQDADRIVVAVVERLRRELNATIRDQ